MQSDRKQDLSDNQKRHSLKYTEALLGDESKKVSGFDFTPEQKNAFVLTASKDNQDSIQENLSALGIPYTKQVSDQSTSFVINFSAMYQKMMQDVVNCAYPMAYAYMKAVNSYFQNSKASVKDLFEGAQAPLEFAVVECRPTLFIRFMPIGTMQELKHIVEGVPFTPGARPRYRLPRAPHPEVQMIMTEFGLPHEFYGDLAKIVKSEEFKLFTELADVSPAAESKAKGKLAAATHSFFSEASIPMPAGISKIMADYSFEEHPLKPFVQHIKTALDEQMKKCSQSSSPFDSNSSNQRYDIHHSVIGDCCKIITEFEKSLSKEHKAGM